MLEITTAWDCIVASSSYC